jgi:hypothetical protein
VVYPISPPQRGQSDVAFCPICGWLEAVPVRCGLLTFCVNPIDCGALLACPVNEAAAVGQILRLQRADDFLPADYLRKLEFRAAEERMTKWGNAARAKLGLSRGIA